MKKKIALLIMIVICFLLLMHFKVIGLLNEALVLSDKYSIDKPSVRPDMSHFVIVIPDKYSAEWKQIKRGAKDVCEKQNAVLESIEMEEYSVAEQRKYIEMGIASKVDGIIIDTMNSSEFDDLITKSFEKGIPIVTLNNTSSGNKYALTVMTDYCKEGSEGARIIAERLKGVGKVVVASTSGQTTSSSSESLRLEGFMREIKNYTQINVLNVQVNDINTLDGRRQIEDIFSNDKYIKGVFGADQKITVGVAGLLESLKKDKSVTMVGIGYRYDILKFIRKGIIHSTLIQDSYRIGEQSITTIIDAKKNRGTKSKYLINPIVINESNADMR